MKKVYWILILLIATGLFLAACDDEPHPDATGYIIIEELTEPNLVTFTHFSPDGEETYQEGYIFDSPDWKFLRVGDVCEESIDTMALEYVFSCEIGIRFAWR